MHQIFVAFSEKLNFKIADEMTFDFGHQSFSHLFYLTTFQQKVVSQKIRGLRDATQLALIIKKKNFVLFFRNYVLCFLKTKLCSAGSPTALECVCCFKYFLPLLLSTRYPIGLNPRSNKQICNLKLCFFNNQTLQSRWSYSTRGSRMSECVCCCE